MSFIKVIEEDRAEGRLKEIYHDIRKSRGKLASVHKIQSLNPESIVKHMDLYMHLMYGKSPLKRCQREMMAVVVSVSNKCNYCAKHHAEALHHYWKDSEKLERFMTDYTTVDLSKTDLALCTYAEKMTKEPSSIEENKDTRQLKSVGLDDLGILDATMIISYFNFVNRMVLGLGVNLEIDSGKGYRYD